MYISECGALLTSFIVLSQVTTCNVSPLHRVRQTARHFRNFEFWRGTPRQTPEQQELEAKRAILAELENQLARVKGCSLRWPQNLRHKSRQGVSSWPKW